MTSCAPPLPSLSLCLSFFLLSFSLGVRARASLSPAASVRVLRFDLIQFPAFSGEVSHSRSVANTVLPACFADLFHGILVLEDAKALNTNTTRSAEPLDVGNYHPNHRLPSWETQTLQANKCWPLGILYASSFSDSCFLSGVSDALFIIYCSLLHSGTS